MSSWLVKVDLARRYHGLVAALLRTWPVLAQNNVLRCRFDQKLWFVGHFLVGAYF